MNTPLELKLIDGAFFIDASTLARYTTCRRSFEYFAIDGKVSEENRAALNFGSAIHEALSIRFLQEDKKALTTIETEQLDHLNQFFLKNPQPLNEWRTHSLAVDIIQRYNSEYLSEAFEVLGVEQSFALPLAMVCGVPVFWTGKIDAITYWPESKSFWIVDHKTTSQLGSTFFEQFKNDQAQIGYVWAATQHLKQTVQGFMVNALYTCKTNPTRSSKKPGEFFSRQKFFVETDRVEEWKENTIHIVEDIFRDASRGYFPMESAWCVGKYGRCMYLPVCELTSKSGRLLLHSPMFSKNEWSPLVKPHGSS